MDNELNNVVFECKNCHNTFIIKEYKKDIYCPYCAKNEFEKKEYNKKIDINYILPFKIAKDDAKKILINNYNKKYFLPEIYKNKNIIDKIVGLYIPVGLYDAEISFSINIKGKKKYNKILKEYDIERVGVSTYNNIIINSGIVNNQDIVFNYSYKDMRKYDISYLSGYITDTNELEYNDLVDFECDDLKDDTLNKIKEDINNYNNIDINKKDLNISKINLKKCFLPVWILPVKIKNSIYYVFINGQNGNIKIDYPYEKIKIIILNIIIFIICLLLSLLLFVFGVI